MQSPVIKLYATQRIQSLDVLKGTVMIIMTLDHVRDYLHDDSFFFDPLDLTQTSPALFFTRRITHFCAPVFVLLSGSSAFLSGRNKPKKQLALFLLKRGLWLILLDVTVLSFVWYYDIYFRTITLDVIWAIGVGMICLAVLIFLEKKYILCIGFTFILFHNLVDNVHVPGNNLQAFLWNILHERKVVTFFGVIFKSSYPVIPWIGVMAVGYVLGSLYGGDYDNSKRKRILLRTGVASIALFIILRSVNVYGNLTPWSQQPTAFFTFLSFINLTKYPPSLDYLLVTLGCALLFLAYAERLPHRFAKITVVYGKVPLFYYALHLYIIHTAAMIVAEFTGFGWSSMTSLLQSIHQSPALKGFGFNLFTVYFSWLTVLAVTYPICNWYGRYKETNREKWWLSYL